MVVGVMVNVGSMLYRVGVWFCGGVRREQHGAGAVDGLVIWSLVKVKGCAFVAETGVSEFFV